MSHIDEVLLSEGWTVQQEGAFPTELCIHCDRLDLECDGSCAIEQAEDDGEDS